MFPGWRIPWMLSRPCHRTREDSIRWWPFDERSWLLKPCDLNSGEQGQSPLTCVTDRYPFPCSCDSVVGNSIAMLLSLGCVYWTILSGSVVFMVKGRGPEHGESYLLTYWALLLPQLPAKQEPGLLSEDPLGCYTTVTTVTPQREKRDISSSTTQRQSRMFEISSWNLSFNDFSSISSINYKLHLKNMY